jgi:hypothetical protein
MNFASSQMQAQGKAVAIYNDVSFTGLSGSGAADFVAPFFAFT